MKWAFWLLTLLPLMALVVLVVFVSLVLLLLGAHATVSEIIDWMQYDLRPWYEKRIP